LRVVRYKFELVGHSTELRKRMNVHLPACESGIELCRHVVEAGHSIPTILVLPTPMTSIEPAL
jgi:hypothetical protein